MARELATDEPEHLTAHDPRQPCRLNNLPAPALRSLARSEAGQHPSFAGELQPATATAMASSEPSRTHGADRVQAADPATQAKRA
jgi:hypothetical protein